jgi:hypothetical protein
LSPPSQFTNYRRESKMDVNRSTFVLMASALAASSVAGAGCDTNFGRAPPAPATATATATASVAQPSGPLDIVQPVPAVPAPVCDDSQGTAEACPSVGPSDEGICRNVVTKRCNEFKAAMKPRVAAQAVACLRALKGNELCDAGRINQCGHAALMSACQEAPRAQKGQLQPAVGTQLATFTIVPDPTPDPSPVVAACNDILRSCGEKSLNPTMADCRQTLAGLNDSGRADMVACVSAHCSDRGLYGCEAVPKTPTP